MDCSDAITWIWESARDGESVPADADGHLRECASCRAELRARRLLARDMRAVRREFEDDPEEALDERVLTTAAAAVAARETGTFAALRPDDRTGGAVAGRAGADPAAPGAFGHRWEPPRATPSWMLAAAFVLTVSLGLGFVLGRLTGVPVLPGSGPVNAALTADGLILQPMPRLHSVGLAQANLKQLQEGNTYLLTGPVGGPYKVMGVVGWDDMDPMLTPVSDTSELIVAMGPAGGWSRGTKLAMNDLSVPSVEILGRRALPSR